MGDLDDLAKAASRAEHVPTHRVSRPAVSVPPRATVVFQEAARPRSAFSVGFFATFGVIAALLVAFAAIEGYRYYEREQAREKLRVALAKADTELREVQARADANRAAQKERERERETAAPPRPRVRQSPPVVRIPATAPSAPAVHFATAAEAISFDVESNTGEKLIFVARNRSSDTIRGASVAVTVDDPANPKYTVKLPDIDPRGDVQCQVSDFYGTLRRAKLSLVGGEIISSP